MRVNKKETTNFKAEYLIHFETHNLGMVVNDQQLTKFTTLTCYACVFDSLSGSNTMCLTELKRWHLLRTEPKHHMICEVNYIVPIQCNFLLTDTTCFLNLQEK